MNVCLLFSCSRPLQAPLKEWLLLLIVYLISNAFILDLIQFHLQYSLDNAMYSFFRMKVAVSPWWCGVQKLLLIHCRLNPGFFLREIHPSPCKQNAGLRSFGVLKTSFCILKTSFTLSEKQFLIFFKVSCRLVLKNINFPLFPWILIIKMQ